MIKIKLSEICDLQNGYAFKSSDYVEKSNTLSCRMSNIRLGGIFDIEYNPRFLPDSFADQYKGFLLKDGDLVIAMTDLANDPKLLGVPTLVQTDGRNILLNQRVGKLIIKDSSKVDNKYLQHVLNDPKTREYYKKFASGGLQINLGKSDLLNVEIPLPSLAEQRRIAYILDQADELRQKRKQAIEKLNQLLEATFIDMFGDPVINPKGWQIGSLNTYGSYKNGLNFGKAESGFKVRYLGVGSFKNHSKIDDMKNLSFIDLNDLPSKDYFLKNGDLVFVRSNGNRELVGRCVAVYPNEELVTYSGFCIRYRIESSELNSSYLVHLFRSKSFKQTILDGGQGANIQNINQQLLTRLQIPIPPKDLQEKWGGFLECLEDQKQNLYKQLDMQNQLFSSLQNQAFSGTL